LRRSSRSASTTLVFDLGSGRFILEIGYLGLSHLAKIAMARGAIEFRRPRHACFTASPERVTKRRRASTLVKLCLD
jgi:hypothetical protein